MIHPVMIIEKPLLSFIIVALMNDTYRPRAMDNNVPTVVIVHKGLPSVRAITSGSRPKRILVNCSCDLFPPVDEDVVLWRRSICEHETESDRGE
jgi:hypothetical protein